jgi:uroporphyrinogen decarboxylase
MPPASARSRRRVADAVRFRPPDRLPCNESLWPDTLESWYTQGLPAGADPADYFDWDIAAMSLDCSPRFDQRVLSIDEPWYTYQDRWGYTATKKRGKASSVHFFDHKTKDRAAWAAHKHRWRLSADPAEPARIDSTSYFEHFEPYPTWAEARQKYLDIYARGRYLLFAAYGPWEATWRHCGYQELLMHTALDPVWVGDMAETHVELTIAVLRRCLQLGMKPDGFLMVEDLAETKGMLFSPASWRSIFKPAVVELGRFLEESGIDFWMHCCGFAEAVFPDLIGAGLQVMNPLQANTGLDVVTLRKKYGSALAFYGNISAVNMSGPREVLAAEIERKIPAARQGGYIFHSDHSLPPDVHFQRYRWVLDTARSCFDSG